MGDVMTKPSNYRLVKGTCVTCVSSGIVCSGDCWLVCYKHYPLCPDDSYTCDDYKEKGE